MKDVKFKERLESAFEAFFDDGKLDDNNSLEFVNDAAIFRVEESESFAEKNRILINILKQVFLFFPAAFILFNMFFAVTVLFITSTNEGYQPYQWNFFVALGLGILGTWFGLGDIKKAEHLAIPFSVISISLIMALVTSLSPMLVEWMFTKANAFLFFPLVLITPFLVKGLVDNSDEKLSI